jgi:hypothetical protein
MWRTGARARAGRIALAGAVSLAAGGVLAVSSVAGTAAADGAPAAAAIRLADGSVACAYDAGSVACRADGVEHAVVLEPDGGAHAGDAAAVAWDRSTPVLLPGESWWNGEAACVAADAEIACRIADGEIRVRAGGAGGASSR